MENTIDEQMENDSISDAKKPKLDFKSDDASSQSINIAENVLNIISKGSKTEPDVGITERLFNGKRGRAILKQRYSDFVVKEVSLIGDIATLSNFICPVDSSEPLNTPGPNDGTEESQEKLKDILSEDELKSLHEMNSNCEKLSVVLNEDNDKVHRKMVHQSIKTAFQNLDTNTADLENGGKAIKVCRKGKSNQPKRRAANSFTHFVLYKENKDTMDAVSLIAKLMRSRTGNFSYAGTKDKRAITSQIVCGCNILPKRLLALNKTLRNIRVGNCTSEKNVLKLGDLKGNHFAIILRDFNGDKAAATDAVDSLSTKGFVNYYGMQRFGNGCLPTSYIGLEILKSNWKAAVDAVICQRKDGIFENIFNTWTLTQDIQKTLDLLPKYQVIERTLLQGLAELGGNAHFNALQRLPRNLRLMYVHSYQSFIWNNAASERVKRFGLALAEGDLVMLPGECKDEHQKPLVVMESDVADAKYSIYDVVLPLPGYDVIYPDNCIKETYVSLLKADNLDMDNMRHKVKDYSLSGAYRNVFVRPEKISHEFLHYDDYKIPLIETDLDALNGVKLDQLLENGKYVAMKICFTLPSSCYATMALRELIEGDSSAAYQTELSRDFNSIEEENNAVLL